MKKLITFILVLFLSINLFSQNQDRELYIINNTTQQYLGLYFADYIPLKDMYITQEEYFTVKPTDKFNKIFTKNLNIEIYIVTDSLYIELLNFKLDCSKVSLELYDKYYQIIYKRYNGEVREQKQYLFKRH